MGLRLYKVSSLSLQASWEKTFWDSLKLIFSGAGNYIQPAIEECTECPL